MRYLLWASTLAVLFSLLRILLFWWHDISLTSAQLAGIGIGLIGTIWMGILLAIAIFSSKKLWKIGGWSASVVLCILHIVAFHYEVVFARLPGVSIIYYLREAIHLDSSVGNSKWLALAEFALLIGVLVCIKKLLAQKTALRTQKGITGICFGISLAIASIVHITPNILPKQMFWASRNVAIHFVGSALINTSYSVRNYNLSQEQIWQFQKFLGHTIPSGGENPAYPLYSPGVPACEGVNGRSVIFLLLESVGMEEMLQLVRGRELMPNLRRIANENLLFTNMFAPGTKTCQTQAAILAGLPPQTYKNVLWKVPFLRMQGFPETLSTCGYQTAYFSGIDLAFEHQREFLKSVGFEETYGYDPQRPSQIGGWGYDDRAMLAKLRNWISPLVAKNIPYFTMLLTDSTHDPFALPKDWQPVFFKDLHRESQSEQDEVRQQVKKLLEAYYFSDYCLGKFYNWYQQHTKNALLIIIGDHVSYVRNSGSYYEYHKVPLIIAGLSDKELQQYRAYRHRLAAMHDLPTTILHLLGLNADGCNQGINLLMKEAVWPKQRMVYAIGGDELERVYFWQNRGHACWDRLRDKLELIELEPVAPLQRSDWPKFRQDIQNFLRIALPLNAYLINNNAYVPPTSPLHIEALPPVTTPMLIDNTGETWTKLTIHSTEEAVPTCKDGNTLQAVLAKLAPTQCVVLEIMEHDFIPTEIKYSRTIGKLIRQYKRHRIIIKGTKASLISSIKHQSPCEAMLTLKLDNNPLEEWLLFAKQVGMDWIAIRHDQIDDALIATAHRYGLKVMALDAKNSKELTVKAELPDGILLCN